MADDAAGAVRRTPRPEIVDQLAGLIEVLQHPPAAECVHCDNARRAAARVLAAGWRPPLPEEQAAGHPLGLDALVGLMLRKARDEDWPDEWCSKVGRALATRVEAGDFDDEDEDESPLPDSVTEWGRRWTGTGVVQEFGNRREDAEDACYPNTELVRREVGPWTEVQP